MLELKQGVIRGNLFMMYGLILAGGSGSRLWPLSRELYPKQLLNIQNTESLLQATFERVSECMPASNIISMTGVKHLSNVKYQLSSMYDKAVVLSEPISKNTAPAIALASKYIIEKFNIDPVILVVPSDHMINNTDKFVMTVKEGEKIAELGYIVTFGIKPSYPETGYGYINVTDKHIERGYKVNKFVEKPNEKLAREYVSAGNYYWNSGIFMFKASVLLEELAKASPEIYSKLSNFDFSESDEIPFTEYDKMPSISIDYAVMEKSDKIALVKLESDWNDLGSWKSIYDVSPKDKDGNVKIGHVLDEGSKNSLMYSSSKLVATIGLEDVVVVETEDAILACKSDKTQDVKKIFETLKKQNDDTHLVHKTVYRPWGYYTVLAQGNGFLTKMIQVNPGQKLSVQSHNFRSEHWVVLEGMAKVILEGKELILSPGHSIDIPLKAVHSLQNPYKDNLKIIEVQKGDPLIEEDIIRYEDMYGRV
ncbi:TPA: mannose-1-phosphate guanylyltransferase/mannose-6-phosphate isomerase [Candidatus Gastranaerophilales bacterium HUM_13]|jgi:mannose-1-phosphate guanylyltransferase/mannose-6-phosphate isomerase|nr:MAG TPA: mannose-1-phosphate guanylyltransferase/mannose-6-phosphate isomerase [Candidatus Gastranaerophilales bacterium HUM_13]DAB11148.1 MAG TPA: mannose-1-phosphate guanylyltransferase/mannose-6-phosphate isomerase [Candidatus Gastranaerophilales bacterium HUM_15]